MTYMIDAQRYFLRLSVLSALALHGTPIRWHDIHGQRTTLLPSAQRALRTCTGQQDHRAAFPFTSASIPWRTALRFLYSASDAICEGRSPLMTPWSDGTTSAQVNPHICTGQQDLRLEQRQS